MVTGRLDPDQSALVIVDIQNDFCAPNGSMHKRGMDLSLVDDAVEKIVKLREAAQEFGIPVTIIRTEHYEEVDSVTWRNRFRDEVSPKAYPTSPNCVPGSWGAEFYKIGPRDGDAVLTKYRYSVFSNAKITRHFKDSGRESLLFCGVTTDICVLSSAIEAMNRDYFASIIGDASAAYSPANQHYSLSLFSQNFGSVFNAQQVIDGWARGRILEEN